MKLSNPLIRPQFSHPLSLWFIVVTAFLLIFPPGTLGEQGIGEGPNLGDDRITQAQIAEGILSFKEILDFGLRIFSTPFNKFDGYGDGRPTLQDNGTFLRVNGLDAQSCLECHSIVSSATIPASFGVGGVGGSSSNVIFRPSYIYMEDGTMDGRFINPPFLFGSGGVELVAKEMTIRLQELKVQALENPGAVVSLEAKGVSFGTIVADGDGNLDTSSIEGINEDLVVRPFGRKGEFATVRAFDSGAMQFHFGMQPVEVFDPPDPDGDGVEDEILIGELSALHIWSTALPKPKMVKLRKNALRGFRIFDKIGCADCHRPFLNTNTKLLTHSFPEVEENPKANIFYEIDLTKTANFRRNKNGGIEVPLFADLKRHYMGPKLEESFEEGDVPRGEFTTARLWGVADTAPYLHDGRALTIKEAILMHGGDAGTSRIDFAALEYKRMQALLSFLHSLRTPTKAIQVK